MRLFIAINFDQETKDKLLQVQNRLKKLGRGNFSREENLHLTLAFLGEVLEDQLEDVKAAMDQVKFPPMELTFHDVGYFVSGREKPSQLWKISLKYSRKLEKVHDELIASLRKAGFSPDAKSFKPHVTLARELHVKDWDKTELLPEPFETAADHMSLMLSERMDGKLTYTELYRTTGK
ncbi:MAG: RNA 2',3'-cyclic phosphodiesterase [Parasporobacterium sp.]|nr:RNA 2',3'-cyclic phosphodiesterase [Parasporobacterium sp.]